VSAAADALGILRLLAATVFPSMLGRALGRSEGDWMPLVLVTVAAATDYTDGMVARRAAIPSRHGALLDNLADIVFVLAVTGAGAAYGLVSWLAPGAIALAFVTYAVASARRSDTAWRPARSRVGHAAGIVNYGLAALVAAAACPLEGGIARTVRPAGFLVAAINLAAVLERLASRQPPRAPASPS